MGGHDFYGKQVMRAAAGRMFVDSGPDVCTDYGAGGARIDGCVDAKVAVEIESRTPKQVRGAVLDLLCHRLQRKMLVLVPAHMDAGRTAIQCRAIFERLGTSPENFRVVVLSGTGDVPHLEQDAASVRDVLSNWGVLDQSTPTLKTGGAL